MRYTVTHKFECELTPVRPLTDEETSNCLISAEVGWQVGDMHGQVFKVTVADGEWYSLEADDGTTELLAKYDIHEVEWKGKEKKEPKENP
jgi:hypothetical protein